MAEGTRERWVLGCFWAAQHMVACYCCSPASGKGALYKHWTQLSLPALLSTQDPAADVERPGGHQSLAPESHNCHSVGAGTSCCQRVIVSVRTIRMEEVVGGRATTWASVSVASGQVPVTQGSQEGPWLQGCQGAGTVRMGAGFNSGFSLCSPQAAERQTHQLRQLEGCQSRAATPTAALSLGRRAAYMGVIC